VGRKKWAVVSGQAVDYNLLKNEANILKVEKKAVSIIFKNQNYENRI
jgi:hypothetical protein